MVKRRNPDTVENVGEWLGIGESCWGRDEARDPDVRMRRLFWDPGQSYAEETNIG